VNDEETRPDRGPAGDAFLALIHAFEPILILAEGVLAERKAQIETLCAAKKRWADHYNATTIHKHGGEAWHYMTEFRRGLEEDLLSPIREAISLGSAAYDRLEAHGPGVADGAARLLTTIELSRLGGGIILRDEAEPLATALRKLTERPKVEPREGS
jgi:hypothetical protein